MGNGNGSAALSTSTVPATTSTSPVARLGFTFLASRAAHLAGHLQAVLAAQPMGHLVVADDHLDDAAGLAKVDEGHPAVIAAAGHPACEGHGLADVLRA